MSFIAGMRGQIPSQSPLRGSAKTRYERVCKKMKTRYVAEGLNFLTMGKKNVLRVFFRHIPLIVKFTDPT